MAITARGFDGLSFQHDEQSFALYHERSALNPQVVWTGGNVTPGTGLAVNVSIIDAVVPGVRFFSDAVTSVSLAANPGTNKRVDYIIAEANYSAVTTALGTLANSVAITKVTGVAAANPVPPALQQSAGSVWQMPLARVTVNGGASSLTSDKVEVCKPLPRKASRPVDFDVPATSFTPTQDNKVVATQAISDPGWPYILAYSASMVFSGDSGYAVMRLQIDGTTHGTSKSDAMTTSSGDVNADLQRFTAPRTGPCTLTLTVSAQGVAAGFPFSSTGGSSNSFQVVQIPA